MDVEDATISGDRLVWRDRRGRCTAARGIELYGPPAGALPAGALERVASGWAAWLRHLPSGYGVQFRAARTGGFAAPLLAYHDTTREPDGSRFSTRQRDERYARYAAADEAGLLQRTCSQLFFWGPSRRGKVPAEDSAGDTLVAEVGRLAAMAGGGVKELGGRDLLASLCRAFNPGATERDLDAVSARTPPGSPLLAACLAGDMVGAGKPAGGFYHGGLYHGCLALDPPPQSTAPGMVEHLTRAPVDGFAVAVNLEPLDVAAEIARAEKLKAKLERARRSGSKHARLDHGAAAAGARVQRLASGAVAPVRLQLIVHAWAPDAPALADKLSTLRQAAAAMASAGTYEVALPTACRSAFFASLPGRPHRDKGFWHLLDDRNVAHMLPVSGHDPASLEGAEALYES